MSSAQSELRCVYCQRLICADEDAQRIEHKTYAHTECAFNVNDTYFVALDAAEESDDNE